MVYVFVNFTFYQRRISAIYEKNNFLSQWKVLQLCKVQNPDLLEFLKRHVSPVAFLCICTCWKYLCSVFWSRYSVMNIVVKIIQHMCQFVKPLNQIEGNEFKDLLVFANAYWLSHGSCKGLPYCLTWIQYFLGKKRFNNQTQKMVMWFIFFHRYHSTYE